MTEETQEKMTEGIDGFFDRLNEAADVVTTKLIEVTPEAAEAILTLVQFKGIFSLLLGLVFFVIPTVMLKLFLGKFKRFCEDADRYDPSPVFIGFGYFAACLVSYIISMVHVFSFYNWVSAFYPVGAVALRALEAAGISL